MRDGPRAVPLPGAVQIAIVQKCHSQFQNSASPILSEHLSSLHFIALTNGGSTFFVLRSTRGEKSAFLLRCTLVRPSIPRQPACLFDSAEIVGGEGRGWDWPTGDWDGISVILRSCAKASLLRFELGPFVVRAPPPPPSPPPRRKQ